MKKGKELQIQAMTDMFRAKMQKQLVEKQAKDLNIKQQKE
jgi:hypothetical protein